MKSTRDAAPMALFGQRLRALRKQQGLTQLAVAERLRVDRTTYNKYEAGRVSPDHQGLLSLAEMFGVTVDYLLGHETETALAVAEKPECPMQLTEPEQLLLQLFRQLTPEEQQKLAQKVQKQFAERRHQRYTSSK